MDLKIRPIKNNVFFIGSKDADRRMFDELIPLTQGTTYNSYLVKGSEKTAIIDTDYPKKLEEYKKRLEENNITKIDYIVSNHAEQDHSGGIPMLLEMYPEAKVVTNAKVKDNVMNLLHVSEDKFIVINDGDELSLGDKTLQFILAPFVHWPDTMFTYLKEDKMLFTCDYLGAHYTKHDLFADYTQELVEAAKRYYAEIIMPFRTFAKKYLEKIKTMDVDIILPSHGPVYDKPEWIIDLYADWVSDNVKNKVVIPYVSMYDSTTMLVERLNKKLTEAGIEVKLFNLVECDEGELSMELVDCATVVLGSSMVLAGPHPAAVMAAYLTNALKPKFKYYSIIGSYGWGGNLEGTLEKMFTAIKPEKLDYVVVKGQTQDKDFAKIDELANQIKEKHKAL